MDHAERRPVFMGMCEARCRARLAFGFGLAGLVFTALPQIDLAVSGLFYTQGQGFRLGASEALQGLREGIWRAALSLCAVSVVMAVLGVTGLKSSPIPARIWGFVAALFLLGPGLLVNGVFKAHWGRARPSDIWEFGGLQSFTPALFPADQCSRNCSFVSGEGAAAAALILSVFVLRPYIACPRRGGVLVWGATALGLVGMALRVMTGRHFLSDTVFAVLIVCAVALGLVALRAWALGLAPRQIRALALVAGRRG